MILLGLALILIRALPVEPAIFLARLITLCYLALRLDYRQEIQANYERIFLKSCPLFWISNGWQVGRNLALMVHIGTRFGATLVDRAVVCWENNNDGQILKQEMHMLMASFHFGLWEFLPRIFAKWGYDVGVLVPAQRNAVIERFIQRIRQDDGVKFIDNLKDVFLRLSQPGITGFMLDNTSRGAQTDIELNNGVRFRMPALAFNIADKAGTNVILVFCYLDQGRLRVKVFPPGTGLSSANALMKMVKERPEEWVFWAKSGALG